MTETNLKTIVPSTTLSKTNLILNSKTPGFIGQK